MTRIVTTKKLMSKNLVTKNYGNKILWQPKMWGQKSMAIENCGNQKPSDKNLWWLKFWQLKYILFTTWFMSIEMAPIWVINKLAMGSPKSHLIIVDPKLTLY